MKNPCVLLLGDSLIDYGNWHHHLSRFTVISSGVPGERTEELGHRLTRSISGRKPDIIVLMTGTNNLLAGDSDFVISTEQIIAELNRSLPHCDIILCGLPAFDIPGTAESVSRVNEQLREIAARRKSCYADLFTPFSQATEALFEYDGVHFTEAAYRLWAEIIRSHTSVLLANQSN